MSNEFTVKATKQNKNKKEKENTTKHNILAQETGWHWNVMALLMVLVELELQNSKMMFKLWMEH